MLAPGQIGTSPKGKAASAATGRIHADGGSGRIRLGDEAADQKSYPTFHMGLTWIPHKREYVVAYAATIILGWLLTQPRENREHRWIQIFITLAAVHTCFYALSLVDGIHTPDFIGLDDSDAYLKSAAIVIATATVLAVTWSGSLATFGGLLLELLIDSPDDRELPQDKISQAFALLRAGDTRRAVRLAGLCIRADRSDLDTRVAAAQVYKTARHFWKARWHCHYVLLNRYAMATHRCRAQQLLEEIEEDRPNPIGRLFKRKPQKIKLS